MPAHTPSPQPARAGLMAVLALCVAAFGCSLGTAAPTATMAAATALPATATGAAAGTPTPTLAASPTPPAETSDPPPTAAAPALAGYAFDDRSPFAASLVPGEQALLAALPGASVYHLALTIDPGLARVQGHQAVRYTNQEDTALPEVVFRLYPNLLGGQVTVTGLTVDEQPAEAVLRQRDTVLSVPLAAPLAPGASVVIALDFDVSVPNTLERNYGVLAAAQGVLALAHFFPYIAVYDDEGWNDEIAPTQGDVTYGDASFFIVQVSAPAGVVVAGAGTVIDRQSSASGETLTFALGPARDFYLAASADYVVVTGQAGDTTVNVYAPAAFSAAAQQTVTDAAAALDVFAARYGPYPYSELDFVATPTYALGIEYPGIIALTNNLLDPNGPNDRLLHEIVTAHEVGHQWFYNLVGSDQLDDPWLDESLTQYVTWVYFLDLGQREAAADFHGSLEGRWSQVDFAEIPIGLPVAEYDGPAYSAIIYGRGALFFEALAQAMGQPAFDTFLANYARTYRWGIATPAGLRALAEEACGCALEAVFAAWVE